MIRRQNIHGDTTSIGNTSMVSSVSKDESYAATITANSSLAHQQHHYASTATSTEDDDSRSSNTSEDVTPSTSSSAGSEATKDLHRHHRNDDENVLIQTPPRPSTRSRQDDDETDDDVIIAVGAAAGVDDSMELRATDMAGISPQAAATIMNRVGRRRLLHDGDAHDVVEPSANEQTHHHTKVGDGDEDVISAMIGRISSSLHADVAKDPILKQMLATKDSSPFAAARVKEILTEVLRSEQGLQLRRLSHRVKMLEERRLQQQPPIVISEQQQPVLVSRSAIVTPSPKKVPAAPIENTQPTAAAQQEVTPGDGQPETKLLKKLERYKNRHDSACSKNQALKVERKSLRNSLKTLHQRCNEIIRMWEEEHREAAQIESALESVVDERDKLRLHCSALEQSMAAMGRECEKIHSTQAALGTATTEVQTLVSDKTRLEAENEQLHQTVDELRAEADTMKKMNLDTSHALEAQTKQLEQEWETEKAKCAFLENELESKDEELRKVQLQAEALDDRNKHLEEKFLKIIHSEAKRQENHDKKVTELNDIIQNLRDELHAKREECKAANAHCELVMQESASVAKAIDEADFEREKAESSATRSMQRIRELEALIKSLSDDKSHLLEAEARAEDAELLTWIKSQQLIQAEEAAHRFALTLRETERFHTAIIESHLKWKLNRLNKLKPDAQLVVAELGAMIHHNGSHPSSRAATTSTSAGGPTALLHQRAKTVAATEALVSRDDAWRYLPEANSSAARHSYGGIPTDSVPPQSSTRTRIYAEHEEPPVAAAGGAGLNETSFMSLLHHVVDDDDDNHQHHPMQSPMPHIPAAAAAAATTRTRPLRGEEDRTSGGVVGVREVTRVGGGGVFVSDKVWQ